MIDDGVAISTHGMDFQLSYVPFFMCAFKYVVAFFLCWNCLVSLTHEREIYLGRERGSQSRNNTTSPAWNNLWLMFTIVCKNSQHKFCLCLTKRGLVFGYLDRSIVFPLLSNIFDIYCLEVFMFWYFDKWKNKHVKKKHNFPFVELLRENNFSWSQEEPKQNEKPHLDLHCKTVHEAKWRKMPNHTNTCTWSHQTATIINTETKSGKYSTTKRHSQMIMGIFLWKPNHLE